MTLAYLAGDGGHPLPHRCRFAFMIRGDDRCYRRGSEAIEREQGVGGSAIRVRDTSFLQLLSMLMVVHVIRCVES